MTEARRQQRRRALAAVAAACSGSLQVAQDGSSTLLRRARQLVPQVSEDLDTERERFADLKRTYNAAVARFEEAQQRGVQEVVSAAEAGLRSSLRTVQERMRSMATEQSSMQRALSEKQERVELLSDSILQLQLSLVDEDASNSRLQEEVAHLRQQLALSISMPAPRSFQEGDDAQLQLLRLRQEKQELQERVRELQRHHDTNAQWEEQLKQLECMQQETQQETERMLGQVRRALCCCSARAAHTRCSGKRTHPALAVAAATAADSHARWSCRRASHAWRVPHPHGSIDDRR